MESNGDFIEVPVPFLRRLLDEQAQYYLICNEFKIPLNQRCKEWVGKGIIERIHNYLTSYVMRRSLAEKETGAAFNESAQPLIKDPEVVDNS